MPMPSAAEMNPSDGALAVFGRVLLGSFVALVVGGALSMVVLIAPAAAGDLASAGGLGAIFGVGASLLVGPLTGFAAATARHWIRRSLRNALVAGVTAWLAWVGLLGLGLGGWLGYALSVWDNVWPFLPAVGLGLVAALLVAVMVYRSEDPLTAQEVAAELRRQKAAARGRASGKPGTRSKKR